MTLKRYRASFIYFAALVLSFSVSMAASGSEDGDETVLFGNQTYSITTWKKEAKEGKPFPQYMLGILYLNGRGVPKDAGLGIEYLRKSAEQEWKGALDLLCYLYVFGDVDNNVEKNFIEAKKWCEVAVNKGSADAYYNLGVMYDGGLGVERNKSKAKSLFAQACDHGAKAGCEEYKKLSEQ